MGFYLQQDYNLCLVAQGFRSVNAKVVLMTDRDGLVFCRGCITPFTSLFDTNTDLFTFFVMLQDKLDGFKAGPLVALEYVLEMQDYDTSKEPVYLCTLCDKRGDPRTVLTHLASYNHITQVSRGFFTAWFLLHLF